MGQAAQEWFGGSLNTTLGSNLLVSQFCPGAQVSNSSKFFPDTDTGVLLNKEASTISYTPSEQKEVCEESSFGRARTDEHSCIMTRDCPLEGECHLPPATGLWIRTGSIPSAGLAFTFISTPQCPTSELLKRLLNTELQKGFDPISVSKAILDQHCPKHFL